MSPIQDPQSVGPINHALLTDVPLLRIFQHLCVRDLLSCRLVNQKWTAIAGIILKSRSTFIPYERLDQLNYTAADYEFEEAFRINLEFLSNRLCIHSHFPFLGFTIFNSSRWSKYPVLQDFARSNGHYFKRLRLDYVDFETVLLVLGQWFTNIEEIIIGYVFVKGDEGDQSQQGFGALLNLKNRGISLPYLRRLTLPPYDQKPLGLGRELGGSILDVAPNISTIENFHPTVTAAVIKHGKLGAVSKFVINQEYEAYLEKLANLSRSGLKLTSLELDCSYDPENPLTSCIAEILQSSKDSLKLLKIRNFCQDPPKMTKLKVLCIVCEANGPSDDEEDEAGPIFETNNPINSYWPTLETVRLALLDCFGSSVRYYFDSEDDVLPTVKTLEILCPYDEAGLSALAKLFPNLSCLRVNWAHWIPDTLLHDLWTIPLEIKELEIYNFSALSDLDSFLTGYGNETCDKLRQKPKLAADPDVLDVFRVNPSIVQLKGLEKLTVFFTLEESHVLPADGASSSPISDWYALGLMPNLRTRFQYDFRGEHAKIMAKALEPYASFVTVEHRSTREVRKLFASSSS